jgi:ATP-dependent DNA ligase
LTWLFLILVSQHSPIAGMSFVAKTIGAYQDHRRLYSVEVSRVRFIPPALATLRSSPPTGERWQYELKFDGYRVQLHKAGTAVTIFSNYAEHTIMRSPRQELRPAAAFS